MELHNIIYQKEGAIRIITLNRIKAMNALSVALVTELALVMDEIAADPEAGAVIITGGEKVFAAGGDLALMANADPLAAEQYATLVGQALTKIENLELPVVAAVSGMALGGGCELALACDLRIAADGAVFGQPEIKLGIIPGAGGTQRLTRVVGPGWAKYLVLTGKNIDAQTAFRIGLVTQVTPPDSLMDEAKRLAFSLAAKSRVAMKAAKKCINYGMGVDLGSGIAYELKNMAFLFSTQDQKEGMKAFFEKRPPQFSGK